MMNGRTAKLNYLLA